VWWQLCVGVHRRTSSVSATCSRRSTSQMVLDVVVMQACVDAVSAASVATRRRHWRLVTWRQLAFDHDTWTDFRHHVVVERLGRPTSGAFTATKAPASPVAELLQSGRQRTLRRRLGGVTAERRRRSVLLIVGRASHWINAGRMSWSGRFTRPTLMMPRLVDRSRVTKHRWPLQRHNTSQQPGYLTVHVTWWVTSY